MRFYPGAWRFLLPVLIMLGGSGPALAQVYSGELGSLAAQAAFTVQGDHLHITFVNTSPAPALTNADVLSALYFTVWGGLTVFIVLRRDRTGPQ